MPNRLDCQTWLNNLVHDVKKLEGRKGNEEKDYGWRQGSYDLNQSAIGQMPVREAKN